jgi:UDP-N-acetyl-D-galactosamine dehydrogenase
VADADEARHEYGVELTAWERSAGGGGHRRRRRPPRVQGAAADRLPVGKLQQGGVLTDVKSMFNEAQLAAHGVTVWRL